MIILEVGNRDNNKQRNLTQQSRLSSGVKIQRHIPLQKNTASTATNL